MSYTFKKLGLIASSVFLLLAALPPSRVPESRLAEDPLVLWDGKWEGYYSGTDAIATGGGTSGTASFNGEMSLVVSVGAVEGTYTIDGESMASNDAAVANGVIHATGIIQGNSQTPQLVLNGGNVVIVVASKEIDFANTINQPIPSEGLAPIPLTLTSVTCSQATGNFNAGLTSNLEGQNLNVGTVSTPFYLAKDSGYGGIDPDAYKQSLDNFMKAVDFLVWKTKSDKKLDGAKLFELLDTSSQLAKSIITIGPCGNFDPKQYLTPFAEGIAKLINLAYDHPDWFNAVNINVLIFAANSTGTIGSGAVNKTLAKELQIKLEFLLDYQLDKAEKESNTSCDFLHSLLVAGKILQNPQGIDKANELLGAKNCSN